MGASSGSWRRADWSGFGWATGEAGLACYAALSTIYLLYFATHVLGFPPVWAGLTLLVPRVWNVVADPIVGVLSDRTRTRFGRRRPYLLGGAVFWGLCFAVLFNLPRGRASALDILLFGAAFLLNNTGLSLYQVPYSTMLAEISRDQNVRTRLAGYREIVARAAVLLTLLSGPWLLGRYASESRGFGIIGAVFGAAIILSGLVAFFATAGAPEPAAAPRHDHGLRAQLATLAGNRPLAWLSASFLMVNVGDAVFSGALVYYLTRILGDSPAAIGTLYPVSSITGILVAPLWWQAANRLGKIPVCRAALALNALCCILPLWLTSGHAALMYVFMVFYGLSNTGARLLPNAMAPDTADLDQARTGERREGAIFGIFVFVQQTGFAVGGFLLSLFLAAGTHVGAAAMPHEPTTTAILLTFTVASAALYGGAFAAILPYRMPAQPILSTSIPS
ncbi:MAG TPA: MFS transporter [Steroidobacteraceae bacterium]|jgi:Na+/melibiose symporter-like transporter|nr:MFS transporter [Steroidobacteraceae bacterium]